jgi:hypothetical protein
MLLGINPQLTFAIPWRRLTLQIFATWRETTYAGTIRQDAVASRHGHVGRARSPRAAYQRFVRADEQKSTWFEEIGGPTQPSLGPALHPAPAGRGLFDEIPAFQLAAVMPVKSEWFDSRLAPPCIRAPAGRGLFTSAYSTPPYHADCCGVATLWLAAVTCFVIFDGPSPFTAEHWKVTSALPPT